MSEDELRDEKSIKESCNNLMWSGRMLLIRL
jgi:hypothetical protein